MTARSHMIVIAVLASVAVLAASGYGFAWSAHEAEQAAQTDLAFRAERAASSIASVTQQTDATVGRLVQNPALLSVLGGAKGCVLQADSAEVFSSLRLEVVGADGRVHCSSNPRVSAHGNHKGSGWLAAALAADGPVVLWDVADPVTRTPSVVVAAPLASKGRAVGAAVVFLHLPWVSAILGHENRAALPLEFVLQDGANRLVLSSSLASSSAASPDLDSVPPDSTGTVDLGDGVGTRLYASSPVSSSPLRVVVMTPQSAVLSAAWGNLVRQVAVALLTILVLLVGLALLDRRVGRPLRLLTAALDRQRQGDVLRAPEVGAAEVVQLARSLNRLTDIRDGHEAQLAHQLTHDMLTGLPNRSLLRQRIEEQVYRGDDVKVSLINIGLDRFKSVNDGLGDASGDEILRTIGERLQAMVDEEPAQVARTGGDEFAVLALGLDEGSSIDLAENLIRGIARTIVRPTGELVVRAKAGVAHGVTSAGDSAEAFAGRMMREATAAMRHAKVSGREWSRFDATLDVGTAFQLKVEQELRLALQREELVVYYQPLVDVASGTTIGAEALVRWRHPARGMVPPLEFIAAAEASGQIVEVGAFVLNQACRDAASWARAERPIRVSVNVAVSQIEAGGFPDVVAGALADAGLPAHLLCLEITESSIMRTGGQRSTDLQRLRDLGVHLAVDDFGTGYSSLAYLHQLPVTELKVDRSFVSRLQGDARHRHMVKAILSMATALGLETVAEGVEDDVQLGYLLEWGCTTAQGYLFAAPQPVDVFLARLTADRTRGAGSIPG